MKKVSLKSPAFVLLVTIAFAACQNSSGPPADCQLFTATDLGTFGGLRSHASDINAQGQVVGWSSLPGTSSLPNGETHAFIWEAGTMTDLGTPGGRFSFAGGLNDSGQVVGRG